MKHHIALIGPRASGKSTLVKMIAGQLGIAFVDFDDELVSAAEAKSMKEAFVQKGQEWLVKKEHEILQENLNSNKSLVIATGGRTISRDYPEIKAKNLELLKKLSFLVFPKASEETYWARIKEDWHKSHSHLNEERLKEQFEIGMTFLPVFEEAADLIISTDKKSLEETTEEILEALDKTAFDLF